MKRFILLAAVALLLATSPGCLHHRVRPGAEACNPGGCGPACGGHCGGLVGLMGGGRVAGAIHETQGWRHQPPQIGPPGPPTGTYAYPYYTLRGPRDFLADDPPSIGN